MSFHSCNSATLRAVGGADQMGEIVESLAHLPGHIFRMNRFLAADAGGPSNQDSARLSASPEGAQVHVHPFESFGKQRNWRSTTSPSSTTGSSTWTPTSGSRPSWCRRCTTALAEPAEAGFHNPHKLMFMGQWLKRSGGYPTYQMRLFHKARCVQGLRARAARGHRADRGSLRAAVPALRILQGPLRLDRQAQPYTSLEALEVIGSRREPLRLRNLFKPRPVKRRRTWKELGYYLPFRPMVRWFVIMFILAGSSRGGRGTPTRSWSRCTSR